MAAGARLDTVEEPSIISTVIKRNFLKIAVPLALIAGMIAATRYYGSHKTRTLTERDTVVLADFANNTGDTVFDETLKTALNVSLRQSPFVNVLSDNRIAALLQLMSRSTETKLTPDVARDLCQRAGSKAYVAGSISSLGSQYVLALKAVDCEGGETLAQEQITAASKEKVLRSMSDAASKLRRELGEGLSSVKKYDVPLAQATTSSLDALRAYSLGDRAARNKGNAALPYYQRAIEIDPNFAMAYEAVGASYFDLNELERANEYFNKAFELREHSSLRERLHITAFYYASVTGELSKAAQIYQQEVENYPREPAGYFDLGIIYDEQGEYRDALEVHRHNLQLDPEDVSTYETVGNDILAMQEFEEAGKTFQQALEKKLDDYILHQQLYAVAFLKSDSVGMVEQLHWFAHRNSYQHFGLSMASDSAAYAGHISKARQLTKQAVESATNADSSEDAALWLEDAAIREAAFGNFTEARQKASEGLKLARKNRIIISEAALAFAMTGDVRRSESLVQELGSHFPLDTQIQLLWMPTIRAEVAIHRENLSVNPNVLLQPPDPIEFGETLSAQNISCLYPTYVRGDAFLRGRQGSAAAAEFQKILDHSGIVWNCWTGALAHLGLARANALQAITSRGEDAYSAHVRAVAAYKDFLALWKDADSDIPIFKQAKAEYAKFQ